MTGGGRSAGHRRLEQVRLRLLAGDVPAGDAGLPPRATRAVRTAAEAGAPLIGALDQARAALEDDAARERSLRVATAQSRAVATGLVAAPVVLLPALAALLDLDLVAFYTTPVGTAVGAAGAGLVGLGVAWIRVAIRRVRRGGGDGGGWVGAAVLAGLVGLLLIGPAAGLAGGVAVGWWRRRGTGGAATPAGLDEVVDLVATAMAGGAGPAAALRLAAAERPDLRGRLRRVAVSIDLQRPPGRLAPGLDRLAGLLVDAHRIGAPAVPALRDLARGLRAEARADALAAAERLPAQLTFPTAVCLLPGSLALIGGPLVHTGLRTAGL